MFKNNTNTIPFLFVDKIYGDYVFKFVNLRYSESQVAQVELKEIGLTPFFSGGRIFEKIAFCFKDCEKINIFVEKSICNSGFLNNGYLSIEISKMIKDMQVFLKITRQTGD